MMEWQLGERLVVPGEMELGVALTLVASGVTEFPPEVMGLEVGQILVGPGVMELGVAH